MPLFVWRNEALRKILSLTICIALLGGCAQTNPAKNAVEARDPDWLIASDLTNAVMQIEGLHPANTHLQIRPSQERFGRTLGEVLATAGYDLQRVARQGGEHFLDYTVQQQHSSATARIETYQLNIDDVSIKRQYRIADSRVLPDSDVFVRGADASTLRWNDHIFTKDGERLGTVVVPVQRTAVDANAELDEPRVAATSTALATPTSSPVTDLIELHMEGKQQPAVYQVGESVRLSVRPSMDSQLSCYYRDGDDVVTRLFPNRFSHVSTVKAGDSLELPESGNWEIRATRARKPEEVLCLAAAIDEQAVPLPASIRPDLQPLPVASLDQVIAVFRDATGTEPVRQRVVINVN